MERFLDSGYACPAMLNPRRSVSFGLAFTAIVSFVGCASAPADRAAPSPSSSPNESIGKAASAVSVNPRPADPGMVFDEPPVMLNQTGDANYYYNYGDGRQQALSFDGTRYFYTWIDPSTGTPMGRFIPESGAPSGVPIHLGPPVGLNNSNTLRSASSAAGAIVMWIGGRNSEFFGDSSGLFGVRIAPDGSRSQFEIGGIETRFPATSSGGWTIEPGYFAAADATGFSIFYYVGGVKGGFDLIYRRMDANGVLGAPVVVLENLDPPLGAYNGGLQNESVRAASNGKRVLVVWIGIGDGGVEDGVHYFTVPLNAPGLAQIHDAPGPNLRLLDLSVGPNEFRAVAYRNGPPGGNVILPFDADGVIGAPMSVMPGQSYNWSQATDDPSIFAGYSWGQDCMQLFSSAGAIGPCAPISYDHDSQSHPYFGRLGVAFGKSTLIEIQPDNDGSNRSSGKLVRYAKNALLEPESITGAVSPVREELPALATDGNDYLLVWRDTRLSVDGVESFALLAQRVNANGKAVGSVVTLSLLPAKQWKASAIFDGKKYVVAWIDSVAGSDESRELMFATMPRSGELAIEAKRSIWSGQTIDDMLGLDGVGSSVGLSSDGVNRMFVWSAVMGDSYGIAGARVSLDGDNLIDATPVRLDRGGGSPYSFPMSAQIAFGGKRSLITWARLSPYGAGGVEGTFIDIGKMEPSSEQLSLLDVGALVYGLHIAASDNDTYFIASEQIASETGNGVRGAYVNSEGKIVGYNSAGKWVEGDPSTTIPIAAKSSSAENVAIAYAKDKTNFVSVWSNVQKDEHDIYGAWIDPRSGEVRDVDGVPIAARNTIQEAMPSIAMRGEGKGLVAYQEYVPAAGAYRIRLRAVDSGELIGAECNVDNDCGTRLCVSGVCCESACNDGCGVCNVIPGTCTPKPKGAVCGNAQLLACNGESLACPSACTTNDDCASKRCVDGICDTPSARCINDGELSDINGVVTSCGDYKCVANACRAPCRDVSDCRDGLVCNFDGACISPPPLPEPQDGCMTSVAPASTRVSTASLGALALVLGIARRRAARATRGAR